MKLFEKIRNIEQDIYRNIVSLKKSEDLFDDLYDDEDEPNTLRKIAQTTERRIKSKIAPDQISREFHYTTAIAYPFEKENYQATRYSNGLFPCWYGTLQDTTSILETAYHTLKYEKNIDPVEDVIIRERAIYQVACNGLLIDLVGKESDYLFLLANDYTGTQSIGVRINSEGHPGILAPSARHRKGECLAVFNQKILDNPRLHYYCEYIIYPRQNKIQVKRNKKIILDKSLEAFSV